MVRRAALSLQGALLVLALPATSAARRAETGPPPEGVALDQVVSATLANNTDLKLAAAQVESARGVLQAAAEPFDSALTVSGTGSQTYQFSPPPAPPSSIAVKQLGLAAGWTKRLRFGLIIAPSLSTTRTRLDSRPDLDVTQASARLTLSLPLLRDLGGVITAAPERAARAEHSASGLDERQAAAQTVLRAALAYWGYLAARRRLEILTASASRAELTATQTAALVQADERTRADLTQAQGFHASRRAARIAAEQEVVNAWQQIAVLAGIAPASLASLPAATTDFPEPGPEPSPGALPGLISRATRLRPDLQAADRRLQGAAVGVQAARNELRSRLDLDVGGGYTAQQRGPEFRHFGDPFYRDLPGLDASVQIRFELPIEHLGARGRLAQNLAAHEQRRLLRVDLERRIGIAVSAAFEVVIESRLALHESAEAVRLLQQTVDNEKHKFRLGSATLFSVIQSEDLLTNGLLARIDGQRAFAAALANLRFESGTVFPPDGQAGAALISRLTSLPD